MAHQDKLDCLLHLNNSQCRSISIARLLCSTCGFAGLQVVWSVILSNGTPFLVSLGLSKPMTALIWVAGPLSGTVIQPLVAALSDQSNFSYGRRRPFIVLGAVGTTLSLLLLASVQKITEGLIAWFDLGAGSLLTGTQSLAVMLIYALNFSIQPLQMGMRVLTVETYAPASQAQVNAWISFMTSIGGILGLITGAAPLKEILFLPNISQFQALCVIAAIAVATTANICCIFSMETRPSPGSLRGRRSAEPNVVGFLMRLTRAYRTVPTTTWKVFQIQFFAWLGWFPFLYYSTSYVGEFYLSSHRFSEPSHAEAARKGSLASLMLAVITLLCNITLSLLFDLEQQPLNQHRSISPKRLQRFNITLAWACGHALFAVGMLTTLLVTNWIAATVLVGLTGISWSLTVWAPHAIIGAQLASEGAQQQAVAEHTGAMMSLHNVAISAPQILAGMASGGIFWLCQLLGSEDGIGWVLRMAGLAMAIACYLTLKLHWSLSK